MWNVEDLIRANQLDIEQITRNIIDPSGLDDKGRKEQIEWYESLIDMMRHENVAEGGHLQMNRNILSQLVDLHQTLLKDPRFPEYDEVFYKTLPFIVELRQKAGENRVGEIETCFNALYGMLMLRLQKRQITADTERAVAQIAKFIALLSKDFHLDEAGELFPHDEDSN